MSYLVDTQIFLWWLNDDTRLSEKTCSLIADGSTEVFLSAASIWEITIKSALGKLEQIKNLSKIAQEEGFLLLNISPEQTEKVATLPLLHKDPFDRLLIAQTIDLKLKFLTADNTLLNYGNFIVAN